MKPEKRASDMTTRELARYIDYSVLKPEFTEDEIVALTKDGVALGVATICINPGYVELCAPLVRGSETMLCPVCDFPFGTSSTASKVQQIAEVARHDEVKEVDVVANFGWIRAGLYDKVERDIRACVDEAHRFGRGVKVILETDALDARQIRRAASVCARAGADFVKTSTGFLTGHTCIGAAPEIFQFFFPSFNVSERGLCH